MYQTETNIFNILKQATEFLTSHNITEAQLDAEVLLCGVLKIKRNILATLRQEKISQEQMSLAEPSTEVGSKPK